jgi:hypothetical protein
VSAWRAAFYRRIGHGGVGRLAVAGPAYTVTGTFGEISSAAVGVLAARKSGATVVDGLLNWVNEIVGPASTK